VCDIVVENFRPGVLDRLGVGWAVLSGVNPALVMLSISGFGQAGPEVHRQAYAPIIHAESGLIGRQAEVSGDAPGDIAFALADSLAGLHGTRWSGCRIGSVTPTPAHPEGFRKPASTLTMCSLTGLRM
jgi:crotonobetainyl-CoA:carnitine CoA-transferase CaiB-like acyl-CoA transferase